MITTGVTYSFLSYNKASTKNISITSNDITFAYSEGEDSITLDEALPISDSIGLTQNNYFEFEVSGSTSSNIEIPYYITVKGLNSNSDISDVIKIGLTKVASDGTDIYDYKSNYGFYTLDECNEVVETMDKSLGATCVK